MKTTLRSKAQTGSALMEALVAIVVFSFGILGLLGFKLLRLRITVMPNTDPMRLILPIKLSLKCGWIARILIITPTIQQGLGAFSLGRHRQMLMSPVGQAKFLI